MPGMQRKSHVSTQREGSHLQTKERGLRGSQLCWHLDLGPSVSETGRINFCCLIHPVCGILSGKPYQPKTDVQYGRVEKGLWPWFTKIRIMWGVPCASRGRRTPAFSLLSLLFLYIIHIPIRNSTRLIFCSVLRGGKSEHCGSKQGFLNEEDLCANLNYTILSK